MHRSTLSVYSYFLRRQNLGLSGSIARSSQTSYSVKRISVVQSRSYSLPQSPAKLAPQRALQEKRDDLYKGPSESDLTDDGQPLSPSHKTYGGINYSVGGSLESKVTHSKSQDQLLELSTSPLLVLKHACLILSKLARLAVQESGAVNLQELYQDQRFINLCNLIQRGNYAQSPQSLFLAMHGLQKFDTSNPTIAHVQKILEVELAWALRRCPVRLLARTLETFSEVENTQSSKPKSKISENNEQYSNNILELAKEALHKRWIEVTAGGDFIATFKISKMLSNDMRGNLEDRAVELVQNFSPSEMRKIFVILGAQKRRPTPLLRALAFHLSKSEEKVGAKDLIELIYALNELTFADPILMEKLCGDLVSELPLVENSALISSLVTSLGQMRYKHKGLLHILDEWISTRLSSLRPFDCASWLLTSAVLNYASPSKEKFFKAARILFGAPLEEIPSIVEWINIVHACLVLDEHTDELLASALNPKITTVVDDLGVKSSKTKIKLLNINAVASKNISKGYKGPLLDTKFEKQWTESVLQASDSKLSSNVLSTLGNFLPPAKYLKVNQKLSCGVFIDAILNLTKNLDPIPTDGGNKEEQFLTVAIIVEGYPSLCLGVKDPSGSSILNRKLLHSAGYTVLPVPYTEFNVSDKLLRRVQYLQQQIKALSKEKSGSTKSAR